jgi:hypothetical protein
MLLIILVSICIGFDLAGILFSQHGKKGFLIGLIFCSAGLILTITQH